MLDVGYLNCHAGGRLNRADLRKVYDVSVLTAAVEEELGIEIPAVLLHP